MFTKDELYDMSRNLRTRYYQILERRDREYEPGTPRWIEATREALRLDHLVEKIVEVNMSLEA